MLLYWYKQLEHPISNFAYVPLSWLSIYGNNKLKLQLIIIEKHVQEPITW